MKTALKLFIIFLLMVWLCACANKDKFYKGICQGMYDSSKQVQEMKNPDAVPLPGKQSPTYEQYKRERQEMLKYHESSPSQQ